MEEKKYKRQKISGIILTVIGGVIFLTGVIAFYYFTRRIRYFIFGIGGIILIIGLGLWVYSGVIKERMRKLEKSERTKILVHTELEERIYNYLKNNENNAFTHKAIMNQLFSDSPNEVSKELIEHSLENLVKRGLIQRTQKDAETFYLY